MITVKRVLANKKVLFALVGLTLVATSLAVPWIRTVSHRKSVASAIEKMNGRVTFQDPPKLIPNWLVNYFGNSYFGEIEGVTLYPTEQDGTQQQIQILRNCPHLKKLAILPGAKGLESCPLDAPGGLNDEGARFLLDNLPQLEHLSITAARNVSGINEMRLKQIKSFQMARHPDFKNMWDQIPFGQNNAFVRFGN
jgi:hypothetical protein